jgi:hypothetical protein
MMATERLADVPVKAPPVEARCGACGGWVGTVPAGTAWMRGRCYNRTEGHDCRLYGKGQTIHLR